MSVWDYYPKEKDSISIENARKAFFYKETPTESIDMYMDPIYLGKYPDRFYELFPRVAERITDEEMKIIGTGTNILCVNNYTGEALDRDGNKIPPKIGAPKSPIYYYYDPNGLYWDVKFLVDRYKLPIYITENGTFYEGTEPENADGFIADDDRIKYLSGFLSWIEKAIDEGFDIRGYYLWSLMDNFEWGGGSRMKFGIMKTDFSNGDVTWKKSAYWYRDFIEKVKRG